MAQFDTSLLVQQLAFPRVYQAKVEKNEIIRERFEKKGVAFPSSMIFWRVFKWNKSMELWAFHEDSQRYVLIHSYPVCEIVGDLGPKREEGDFQIPEGFYSLTILNPNSKYHLSIKVNYPNQSDQILGNTSKLGGEIYVHGGCETIGCIPMTDNMINEIYLINLYAKVNGQFEVPIHIFPTRLTTKNINKLKQEYFKDNVSLINFWMNLKTGYDYFEKKKELPTISVDSNGKYIFM